MRQWTANITQMASKPRYAARFSIFVAADDELGAARAAAESVAKSIYGPDWFVGYVQQQGGPNLHLAAIGTFERGTVGGITLEILIREYAGAQ